MSGQQNYPPIWLRRLFCRYQRHRRSFSILYECITDIVSCVLRYRICGVPSTVEFRISGFSSLIGQAILQMMESYELVHNDVAYPLERVLGVIAACHGRWDAATKTWKICQFLCNLSILVATHQPLDYFRYFAYLCLLCEKFNEADRPDCVQTAIELTFILFFLLSDTFTNFDILEPCAQDFLQTFG